MLGSGQEGRRRHYGPRRGREIGQFIGPREGRLGAVSHWDLGVQISEAEVWELRAQARVGGPCGLPSPLASGRARAPPELQGTKPQ